MLILSDTLWTKEGKPENSEKTQTIKQGHSILKMMWLLDEPGISADQAEFKAFCIVLKTSTTTCITH